MMKNRLLALLIAGALFAIILGSCAGVKPAEKPETTQETEPAGVQPAAESPAAETASEIPTDIAQYEKTGFTVLFEDGRLWVFHEGSKEYEDFKKQGEPVRQVIRPGAGPFGITLKSTDAYILDEYQTTLPGYFTRMEDGRLWIFRTGSKELEEFLKVGEPVKQVIRPAAGPFGMTVKAVDSELIDEYMEKWEKAAM